MVYRLPFLFRILHQIKGNTANDMNYNPAGEASGVRAVRITVQELGCGV